MVSKNPAYPVLVSLNIYFVFFFDPTWWLPDFWSINSTNSHPWWIFCNKIPMKSKRTVICDKFLAGKSTILWISLYSLWKDIGPFSCLRFFKLWFYPRNLTLPPFKRKSPFSKHHFFCVVLYHFSRDLDVFVLPFPGYGTGDRWARPVGRVYMRETNDRSFDEVQLEGQIPARTTAGWIFSTIVSDFDEWWMMMLLMMMRFYWSILRKKKLYTYIDTFHV